MIVYEKTEKTEKVMCSGNLKEVAAECLNLISNIGCVQQAKNARKEAI